MMQLQVSTLARKLVWKIGNILRQIYIKACQLKVKTLFLLTHRNMESSKKHIEIIIEICKQKRKLINTMGKHMSLKHFATKQMLL